MKKTSITAFIMLVITAFCFAQTTVLNPKTGFCTAGNLKLTKIELSDTATILSFDVKYRPKNWISVPAKTFIQPINSTEKYYVKYSEGIKINENFIMPESGKTSYRLFFAAIPKDTKVIDFGEGNDGGSWFIYDISLVPNTTKLLLPDDLYSNWYSMSTGDLTLSINENYIVYKNQIWKFSQIKTIKEAHSVQLSANNGISKTLYLKAEKNGNYLIGESISELQSFTNNRVEALKTAIINNEPYKLPIFKLDSATYSGYVKDYSPRIGVKTISLSTDDIFTGNQSSHLIKIDENGYFTIKVPIYYPSLCWIRSKLYNGSVFLEPGKSVFQVLDYSSKNGNQLFMGDIARTNVDLLKLQNIRSFDYEDMRKVILDMTPTQYKDYCKKAEAKDLKELDSIKNTTKLSEKAYQISKLEIKYNAMSNMMSYDMYFESAYREKNKIPRTQRELDIKIDTLTAEYFDFINAETVNNQLAVIASSYNSFINRLKYLDILHNNKSITINASFIGNELIKSGYNLTDFEKTMLDKNKKVDSLLNLPERKAYQEQYGKQIAAFYAKFQKELNSAYKDNPNAAPKVVESYFKDNKIKLNNDEKKLLKIMSEFDNSKETQTIMAFFKEYGDSISAFHKKHNLFVDEYFVKKRINDRNEQIKSLFNIEAGFATDIMLAQDLSRKIVEEVSPVSEQKLKTIQQQFVTPFIAEYIAVCNNNSIAKLEANKKKTGFTVNETPKTEADKIFDAIMLKFRGKVVYVDFWATWCAPCRSGIERIKPLKEEMDLSKVAFVYITNQTSPLTTWNNMIPDIKGEHYRISDDEWNYLKSKFQISGIPHYVLVGKKGEVINPKLGFMDNEGIKSMIEKHFKE